MVICKVNSQIHNSFYFSSLPLTGSLLLSMSFENTHTHTRNYAHQIYRSNDCCITFALFHFSFPLSAILLVLVYFEEVYFSLQ